ncbi:membrane protein [Vibrio inusitatus NBRC 102082]|uniref:Membrane protein n=1 Tax=Vibrio inusitatus NBRC 102082 TaxID=1219070 RepID=A0A4Y3HXH3_9VIBR|nr:MotA/TolQ/ExbB proton channel family protein [Vibrio inusitatus]GEA51410.1 membrane protein [Vibrio inusitatus NBRC 102082]
MSESLANLISSFSAATISDVFLTIITLILVVAIYFSSKDLHRPFINYAPNLLTSLGILGTFTGIVIGLMEFNPQDIDNSISLLLAGLKTAFLTSLYGMLASIILKGWHGYVTRDDGEESGDVGPELIYQAIKEQSEYSQKQFLASRELVEAIKGDEDSSLTSQIKNLRIDSNDANNRLLESFKQQKEFGEAFQKQLWLELQHFGDLLSKSATEQVINALKEVIVDFNNNLTEQFGENFKRLDESVKKLVDWQENYRIQLEDMANKYQLGVDAISSTEQSVAHISERAESIPQTMEKLHSVMELGHGQVTELEERLEAFKDLRDKAVEAMPQIREQMDTTMSVIGDSVKAASSHYENMLSESQKIIDNFSTTATESVDTMRTNLEQGAEKVSEQLNTGAIEIGGRLAEASNDIQGNVTTASGALQSASDYLTDNAEKIKQQLEDSTVELNAQLRVLVADIKDDAKATGQVLKDSNQELISSTQAAQTEMTDQIRSLSGEMREEAKLTSQILKDSNHELMTSTKAVQNEMNSAVSKLQDRLELTLEEIFKVQANAIQRTFDSLENQITDSVGKTGSAVEKQVEVLDLQMQQEINRTMNEMGEALATITQQFTRDYRGLVREMSNVMNSSVAV